MKLNLNAGLFAATLLSATLLVGCGGGAQTTPDDVPVDDLGASGQSSPGDTSIDGTTSGAATGYVGADGTVGRAFVDQGVVYDLNDQTSPLSQRTLYFDYDSAQLTIESQQLLIHHANYLQRNSDIQIVVEGHTDERGSREYNLSLGERRGSAVKEYLMLQGVALGQLDVVSFGEERPVAIEHDEQGWRLNRRVELLYPAN